MPKCKLIVIIQFVPLLPQKSYAWVDINA